MKKPTRPVGKESLRSLLTDATFRGGVKCSAPYPVESDLPERLQELLKLMDEAEREAGWLSKPE